MFLNKTRFKKWIKDAFNSGGLSVGQVYGGLVINGGYWTTWTEDGYVPNWVKAAVMEYTGELPKQGHVFKAKKETPLQYEIAENEHLNLPEMFYKAKVPFTVTSIVYDRSWEQYRFVQNDHTGNIFAVSAYLYDVLDMKELGEENRPTGPSSVNEKGDVLLWKNEHAALAICRTDVTGDKSDIMNILSTYSFEEGVI